MKIVVNIARVIVGLLFIFSGLVKAIDPLGLAYKMQEFFEVWSNDGYMPALMHFLDRFALWFSMLMIILEVVLGVALLIGWRKNLTPWLLLLLILFFTFLTAYVLFSGKIRACGCFGDCIKITPVQTFTKDLILLFLILLILKGKKHIRPLFRKAGDWVLLASFTGTTFLQLYVLKHLPVIDCLPYKKGNNILKLRQMPEDAVPDKYEYRFVYEKNGRQKEFTTDNLPDSTWKFVDRKQILIQKGKNNVPLINDFSLKSDRTIYVYSKDGIESGFEGNELPDSTWKFKGKKIATADSTEAVLNQPGEYYLFFVKELEPNPSWANSFRHFVDRTKWSGRKVYIVTADKEKADQFFNKQHNLNLPVFIADVTAIKTAARTNPMLIMMNGPVVVQKWSWANLDEADTDQENEKKVINCDYLKLKLKIFLTTLIYSVSILIGVVILVFLMFQGFGDPARMIVGQTGDRKTLENVRRDLYLDQPKWKQFLFYLNDVSPLCIHSREEIKSKQLTGLFIGGEKKAGLKIPYLGKSYQTKKSVGTVLMEALPGTLLLAIAAILFATVFGILLGVIAAVKKNTWMDTTAVFTSIAGISAPSFFMAIMIAFLFGVVWHNYTGLNLTGSWFEIDEVTGEKYLTLKNLILPALTLGIRPLAIITQLTRSSMLDVLSQDYIRTARAKGLPESRVIFKHALRNALNPVITSITGWFAELLAGAFFVEYIFGWKGIGKITVDALEKLDYPVVMGSVLLSAFIFIVINALADLLYRIADPRLRM